MPAINQPKRKLTVFPATASPQGCVFEVVRESASAALSTRQLLLNNKVGSLAQTYTF
jgi:hypothetical protein